MENIKEICEYLGVKYINKYHAKNAWQNYKDEKKNLWIYGDKARVIAYRNLNGFSIAWNIERGKQNPATVKIFLDQVRLEMRKDGLVE